MGPDSPILGSSNQHTLARVTSDVRVGTDIRHRIRQQHPPRLMASRSFHIYDIRKMDVPPKERSLKYMTRLLTCMPAWWLRFVFFPLFFLPSLSPFRDNVTIGIHICSVFIGLHLPLPRRRNWNSPCSFTRGSSRDDLEINEASYLFLHVSIHLLPSFMVIYHLADFFILLSLLLGPNFKLVYSRIRNCIRWRYWPESSYYHFLQLCTWRGKYTPSKINPSRITDSRSCSIKLVHWSFTTLSHHLREYLMLSWRFLILRKIFRHGVTFPLSSADQLAGTRYVLGMLYRQFFYCSFAVLTTS